mgnify:CR=1 FL=1
MIMCLVGSILLVILLVVLIKKDNEQFTIIDGTYIKLNMKAADPYEDAERRLKAAKKVGKIIPKMEH